MPEHPPPRISLAELRQKLGDIDVPDAEIARYLTGSPGTGGAFAPAVLPDPARVDIPPAAELATRGAAAMAMFNGIAQRRRRKRFERAIADPADTRPVLLAEGDSWFQFPFLIDDVVDHLDAKFRVRCLSAAGDTLKNMVLDDPEWEDELTALLPRAPRAFLFSGTGNDFLGDEDGVSILGSVVRPFTAGLSAEGHIDTTAFRQRFDFVRTTLIALLARIGQRFPAMRVVLQGYDHAIPFQGPGDPRDPVYARADQWVGGPLREVCGIQDRDLQRRIVRAIVDRQNDLLASLCGGNTAQGIFAFAWHADIRGANPDVGDWNDEIHPTSAGFVRVADRIAKLV